MRFFTPEPSLTLVPSTHHVIDRRRYSTAGNLDIYRPKSQRITYSYETPLFDGTSSHVVETKRTVAESPILYWRSPVYDKTDDVKKITELRAHTNGPSSTHVSYLPSVSRSTYSSPLPSDLTSMDRYYYGRASTPLRYSSSYYPYTSYSLPRYSSSYYNDRPYYSDSYSYPYYYTSPYYSSYYNSPSYYNRGYYGDLDYYGSRYYPSRYSYSYVI